ncbi:IS701 family transposase [Streptomyces pratensis]|uniref:IS701 family transposase n=1 Tax=Streptomyces pratensis TaxID=1169025 RepID=UPI003643112E
MLITLPRRDQRERGEWYVSGLLSLSGRKSMRSIASLVGGSAAEQRLQHFISKSPWEWEPVRKALASHVDRALAPHAWVVKPMVVLKTGDHTVGVQESFVPQLGRMANNQRSYSVWLANEQRSVPVNWRLVLPQSWIEDEARRRRAEIPDALCASRRSTCALEAALEVTDGWGLRRRPIVMDAREHDAAALVRRLTRADVPFVLRVHEETPLIRLDVLSSYRREQPVSARKLVAGVKWASREVGRADAESSLTPPALVTGTKVILPHLPTDSARPDAKESRTGEPPLQLARVWSGNSRQPRELWLSNLTETAPAVLLRMGRLTARVDRDFAEVSNEVGAMDFEGRTFGGWHRHMTLTSVAHGFVALSAPRQHAQEPPRWGHLGPA